MCVSALPAWNLLSGQTGKNKVSTFFKSQVNLLSYTAFKQPNITTTFVPSVNIIHTKLSIINKTKFCFKQKIRVMHVGKIKISPETVILPQATTLINIVSHLTLGLSSNFSLLVSGPDQFLLHCKMFIAFVIQLWQPKMSPPPKGQTLTVENFWPGPKKKFLRQTQKGLSYLEDKTGNTGILNVKKDYSLKNSIWKVTSPATN